MNQPKSILKNTLPAASNKKSTYHESPYKSDDQDQDFQQENDDDEEEKYVDEAHDRDYEH